MKYFISLNETTALPEAYHIFHKSMLRGSETAFHALRSMHDEIRPPDEIFHIIE
jgi:hypothetical protein